MVTSAGCSQVKQPARVTRASVGEATGAAQIQNTAQIALEVGNSPQIIFQHYRELVRPKDAKGWFSIAPGADGRVVYLEVPKDGEQKGGDHPSPAPVN